MRIDAKKTVFKDWKGSMDWKGCKGTAAVITAIIMTVILGFAALVIDIGRFTFEKSRFQNAVDAAALAAAQDLPDTTAAFATASDYMVKNGYDPMDITVSFAKLNRQITVAGAKRVNFMLAKVIGIEQADAINDAVAEKGGRFINEVFNYAIFSGSPLDELNFNTNGEDSTVQGSIHSNNKFRFNGNQEHLTISGAINTVDRITLNGTNVSVGALQPYSRSISMPDFSAEVLALAQSVGQVYNTNQNFNSNITVNGAMYVDGHINFNCQKFSGVGTIMATGNIAFNNSVVYGSPDSSICIYSKNGDITVNNTSAIVNGTFYAPNGTVTFNNGAHTINGRVIAKKLVFNGGVTVYGETDDVRFLDVIDDEIKLVK